MLSTEEQKEIKKKLAGKKRKISEIAGEIHDIVEDTLWSEYDLLPELSKKIQIAMQEMLEFKSQYSFLK